MSPIDGGLSFGSYGHITSLGHCVYDSTISKKPLPFAPSYKHHQLIVFFFPAESCRLCIFFSLQTVKCPLFSVGWNLCSCASALSVNDDNVEQSTRECSNKSKTESNKHSVKYFLSSLLSFIYHLLSLLTDVSLSF